jgi:hypothetical protein
VFGHADRLIVIRRIEFLCAIAIEVNAHVVARDGYATNSPGLTAGECEAAHTSNAAFALLLRAAGGGLSGIAAMSMRRMIYWWFRCVMSGRFLNRFLTLQNTPE